ncbi:MAG: cytochrome c oxidase accessory protein CcoG [Porticoccaceae bacterium]
MTEGNQRDRAASEEVVQVLDLYETREKIYTRRLKGFYRSLASWTWIPLLGGYFLLPWLNFAGRQAVWFDLPARKFHILGLTFWPQDFMLLAWLLIIAAFALFTVTVLVGRVWCGFTCPQTVWTMLFIGAEHLWEGDRNQRIKLDKAPWSANKVIRKGGKQASWVLIALVTGFTFVGYFNPIRELVPDFFTLNAHPAAVFWTLFFAFMTYMNAGFLREQVCMYMCPYARFQAVMFDRDTLVVSYDVRRGEPRGARKKGADHATEGLGDCVDCSLCVQVCPTGIDIRDGLQYECISCGLCIDACDAVMDKMGYPRKLISFTTENAQQTGKTRVLRPRFIGYSLVLLMMASLFTWTVATRVPLDINVLRERNQLFRETADGLVENVYTLRINNMDNGDHRYRIAVLGDYDFAIKGDREVSVAGGEVYTTLLRLEVDPGLLREPNTTVVFEVTAIDDPGLAVREESRFIGPSLGARP